MSGTPAQVRLTSDQVESIVSAATTGTGEVVMLLPELFSRRQLPPLVAWEQHMRQMTEEDFSSSLARGLMLLERLVDGRVASGEELAGELGLSSRAAGRYLQTLVLAGLVERERDTSRYRLVS